MDELRSQIDDIDWQILALIGRRMRIVSEIAAVKAKNGNPIRDMDREKEILDRVTAQALRIGVSPDTAEKIFQIIIDDAVQMQILQQKTAIAR